MGKARIMFLWPCGPRDEVGAVIQAAEGPDEPTHVAVVLDYALLEAEWYGVVRSPFDKYKNRRHEIWEIDVLYPQHSAIAVQVLLGKRYSLLACLLGFLRIKFGIKIPFCDAYHVNCSETGTEYAAMLGRDLFGSDSPAGITPSELLDKIKYMGGMLVEKGGAES